MEKNPRALQSQGWALTSSCRQGANPTSFLPFQEWKSSKEKIFRTKRIKAERFKELRRVNSWREAGRAACSPVWCQTPKHPALSSIFNWETAQADRISCWMCSSQVQFKWNRYEIKAVLLAGMAKKPPSMGLCGEQKTRELTKPETEPQKLRATFDTGVLELCGLILNSRDNSYCSARCPQTVFRRPCTGETPQVVLPEAESPAVIQAVCDLLNPRLVYAGIFILVFSSVLKKVSSLVLCAQSNLIW